MDNVLPSGSSALFIQKGMGEQPMFRGLHAFTGDLSKSDGAVTPIYQSDIGEAVRVARTRSAPDPVSISLDAPLQAIGDLVGAAFDCPLHMVMIADSCLSPNAKRSWGRWGDTDPDVILLIPDAHIEQRALGNLMTRELGNSIAMGSVQVKFENWSLIRGGNEVALTDVSVDASLVGLASTNSAGCRNPECGGSDACAVWYVSDDSGSLWKRNPESGVWTKVLIASSWAACHSGLYADDRLVLAGGSDGAGAGYGVIRSADGGWTWSKSFFDPDSDAIVRQIVRHGQKFSAFTSAGIWRSLNDGETWSLVRSGAVLSGAFDGDFGVAIGPGTVYVTRNAGKKWTTVTAFGTHQTDVALAGGYVHISDSVAGYARADVKNVRERAHIVWDVRDTAADISQIGFSDAMLGYRLQGTVIGRTLSGGYSWEDLSLSESGLSFTRMALCGGRLGVIADTRFGYYSPFFDDEYLAGEALVYQFAIALSDTDGWAANDDSGLKAE